jgi:hypothetical protein
MAHRRDLVVELEERWPVLSLERGPCTKRGGTVGPTDSFLQTDVEPRLQLGRRLHKPCRRCRLEAVRIAEAADRKQTVTQVQQGK